MEKGTAEQPCSAFAVTDADYAQSEKIVKPSERYYLLEMLLDRCYILLQSRSGLVQIPDSQGIRYLSVVRGFGLRIIIQGKGIVDCEEAGAALEYAVKDAVCE